MFFSFGKNICPLPPPKLFLSITTEWKPKQFYLSTTGNTVSWNTLMSSSSTENITEADSTEQIHVDLFYMQSYQKQQVFYILFNHSIIVSSLYERQCILSGHCTELGSLSSIPPVKAQVQRDPGQVVSLSVSTTTFCSPFLLQSEEFDILTLFIKAFQSQLNLQT